MKRVIIVLLVCIGLSGVCWHASAQSEEEIAAAIAERRDEIERYNRLNAAVEELLAAYVAQKKTIAALSDEVQQLQAEVARLKNNGDVYASKEYVVNLAQKVQEVDDKREADKKLILDELQKLADKVILFQPSPPVSTTPSNSMAKGYEYVIQSGDTISAIVAAYRKQGVKVTIDQVLKANPAVKPDSLQIGQRLFIPDPSL